MPRTKDEDLDTERAILDTEDDFLGIEDKVLEVLDLILEVLHVLDVEDGVLEGRDLDLVQDRGPRPRH